MTVRRLVLVLLVLAIAAAAAPGTASAFPDPDCSPPTISGTARVSQTLTGNQTACAGFPTPSYSWAWSRCDSTGGPCTPVGSGQSYTLTSGDLGKYMRVVRTASNGIPPNDVDEAFSAKVKGHPPTASFTAGPNPVKRNQTVTFNGSGSSDPDGQALTYRWDLDGNGSYEVNSGSSATTSRSFSTSGTKTVHLQVRDTDGDTATATRTVTVKSPPTAGFTYSPLFPEAGDTVTFVSTSKDPDGDALSYAWDLDGDGAFDDGNSGQVSVAYGAAGTYTVTLRVTADGETSTAFFTVTVSAAPGSPTTKTGKYKLLRPFPVVAIGGFVTGDGVRLTLLAVKAPRRSKVLVRCYGHGCPRRTTRARVGRKKVVVFRSFRRHFRAGAVIKVYVWKKNRIGKYTRFLIRRGQRPARRDRCIEPVKLRRIKCP